jgi:hypothetical protein
VELAVQSPPYVAMVNHDCDWVTCPSQFQSQLPFGPGDVCPAWGGIVKSGPWEPVHEYALLALFGPAMHV